MSTYEDDWADASANPGEARQWAKAWRRKKGRELLQRQNLPLFEAGEIEEAWRGRERSTDDQRELFAQKGEER